MDAPPRLDHVFWLVIPVLPGSEARRAREWNKEFKLLVELHLSALKSRNIWFPRKFKNLVSLKLSAHGSNVICDLMALSLLTNLQILDMCGGGDSEPSQLRSLEGIERLITLTHLSLNGQSMGVAHTEANAELLRITALTRLTNLDIRRLNVSDISCLSTLSSIQSLELFQDNQQVLHLPVFAALRELNLQQCRTDAAGWIALSACTSLTYLCFCPPFRPQHVPDLSGVSNLVSLQRLNLTVNADVDVVVAALTHELTHLTHLILCLLVGSLTGNGLRHLSRLQRLHHLDLRTLHELHTLRNVTTLSTLRSLDLNNCFCAEDPPTDFGCMVGLTSLKLPHPIPSPVILTSLTSLVCLYANKTGYIMLVGLSSLTGLTMLSLKQSGLTDADLPQIAQLTRLRNINLNMNAGVTAAGKMSLLHLGCRQ
jgi:Leucine-rich repeat (LRR) protein